MGAPETTAAGRVSPGSLPSRTRLGTGEKVEVAESISAPQSGWWVVDIDGTCGSPDSVTARESDSLDVDVWRASVLGRHVVLEIRRRDISDDGG